MLRMRFSWLVGVGLALLAPRSFAQAETPKPAAPAAPQIVPPKILRDDGAMYPEAALAEHLKETFRVVLVLELDAQGRVRKAAPESPIGHGFDEAAVAAAEKIQFEPATRDGAPIAARIKHVYEFPPPPSVVRVRVQDEQTRPMDGVTVLARPNSAPFSCVTHTNVAEGAGICVAEKSVSGAYSLVARMEGYEEETAAFEIEPGEDASITIRLHKTLPPSVLLPDVEVEEINVRGQKPPREVTKRTLEQRELSRIPGTSGDALRALQNLPGVARPPGLAGLLIVRGSGPQDTNIFFDGTLIPLVYHFGGLSSVVPTELLERIDFYPGNFSTQYGRVMGGVVDVALRDPKKDQLHGLAQLDLIDARLLAEGPIGKSGWSFAVAGRRSWVDAWLKPVLERTGAGVSTAPVYYDYQAILARDWGKKASLRFTLLGSDDRLDLLVKSPSASDPALAGGLSAHTGFWRAQARYKQKLGDDSELRTTTAFGEDVVDLTLGSNFFRLTSFPFTSRVEIAQKVDKGVQMNIGWDILYNPFDVNVRFPPPGRPGEPPGGPFLSRPPRTVVQTGSQVRPGAFVDFEVTRWKGGRLIPGIRADYSKDIQQWDVSPRVVIRQDVTFGFPRTTLKGGVGIFRQPPQPQETTAEFGQKGLVSNQAVHTSLGAERELTKNIELSIEGFYKKLDYLVTTNSGNSGEGYVVGAETLLRYKPDEHFFGWLAYTLSRSARRDQPDAPERLIAFDQTHILTMLGSYRLGRGWEIGGRFRLVSGNLYTPNTYGFYDENAGVLLPLSSYPPNTARLPLFHQLDVRVDKMWKFQHWKLSAYLDLQNAYNNGNVEGVSYNYNFTQRTYATGLPILPSLGIRGEL